MELVKRAAAEKNAIPAQIALAWVLARKPWIVPIPGTRKLERLEGNLGAVEISLINIELSELNAALSKTKVLGDRYPSGLDYAKKAGK